MKPCSPGEGSDIGRATSFEPSHDVFGGEDGVALKFVKDFLWQCVLNEAHVGHGNFFGVAVCLRGAAG